MRKELVDGYKKKMKGEEPVAPADLNEAKIESAPAAVALSVVQRYREYKKSLKETYPFTCSSGLEVELRRIKPRELISQVFMPLGINIFGGNFKPEEVDEEKQRKFKELLASLAAIKPPIYYTNGVETELPDDGLLSSELEEDDLDEINFAINASMGRVGSEAEAVRPFSSQKADVGSSTASHRPTGKGHQNS